MPCADFGQLELVIVVSYVSLFGIIGTLILLESLRAIWDKYRGIVRTLRRAGEHAWYLGLPLKMRFPRSKLYGSVIPLVAIRPPSASRAPCWASAAASSSCRR